MNQEPKGLSSSFAENLKAARKKAGLNQAQLGEKLGVSSLTISSWETGRKQPDLDKIGKISEALSILPSELFITEKNKRVHFAETEAEFFSSLVSVVFSKYVSFCAYNSDWENFGESGLSADLEIRLGSVAGDFAKDVSFELDRAIANMRQLWSIHFSQSGLDIDALRNLIESLLSNLQ